MKYVVRKLGWAGFLAKFEEELALVRRAVPIDLTDADALARPLVRLPLARAEAAPGFERWREGNVRAQKQPGFAAVTVRLVRGDITAAQFRGVADLARRFGDGMARLTIDQNLLLRFVPEAQVPAVHAGLAALGLATPDAGTIVDVTSCPGAESCNLAVTSSRELASDLSAKLDVTDPVVAQARELDIKLSGCPNSCGQHHIAAIGFHGGMRRVGGKVVPEYTLHLGGGVDGTGATFGRQVVKLPARRVADALVRLLKLYDAQKQAGEKALAFFRRVSDLEVKAAVADLTKLRRTARRTRISWIWATPRPSSSTPAKASARSERARAGSGLQARQVSGDLAAVRELRRRTDVLAAAEATDRAWLGASRTRGAAPPRSPSSRRSEAVCTLRWPARRGARRGRSVKLEHGEVPFGGLGASWSAVLPPMSQPGRTGHEQRADAFQIVRSTAGHHRRRGERPGVGGRAGGSPGARRGRRPTHARRADPRAARTGASSRRNPGGASASSRASGYSADFSS